MRIHSILILILITFGFIHFSHAKDQVNWNKWDSSVFEKAENSGKHILIDFYADWCGPCKMMDNVTYSNKKVVETLENYISIKLDVDEYPDVAAEFNIGNLPATGMITSDKGRIFLEEGFFDAKSFLKLIAKGEEIYQNLVKLEANVEKEPENIPLHFDLMEAYIAMYYDVKIIGLIEKLQELVGDDNSPDGMRLLFYKGYSQLLQDNHLEGIQLLEQFKAATPNEEFKQKASILIQTGQFIYAEELFKSGQIIEAKKIYQELYDTTDQSNILYASKQRLYEIDYLEKRSKS